MQTISDYLKSPLQCSTTQLLGELIPEKPLCDCDCITTIYTIALALIFGACLIASIPLWFAGEMLEILSCSDFDEPEVALRPLGAFPGRTDYLGFPISTYQYTADPNFCANSDWGRYSATHFVGDRAHLAPGQGVDILTDEGMRQICDATIAANGNTVRFSVEWPHATNDVAMQKYVRAAEYIASRGLKPMVVLHHFVTPLDQNGNSVFESPESIDQFVRYAQTVHSSLRHVVHHFMTFNEPKVHCVENYVLGDFPAGGIARFWKCEQVARNMFEAHTRTYDALHRIDPNVTIGLTHQVIHFTPSSRWNYLARITCFVMTYVFHESFMARLERHRNKVDLFGIQYYTRPLIGSFPPDSICREGETMVEAMRFRFDPKGILPILREAGQRLQGVPLFVSETGTAGRNDVERPNVMDQRRREYMRLSLQAVATAQAEGIDVRGYMPWAPFPNTEWHHGFSQEHDFGLIARNPRTNQIRYTEGFYTLAAFFSRSLQIANAASA